MAPQRSSIAVIGSGISGLGVAYLLRPRHDITVYEKGPHIGGHARTINIDYDGRQFDIDTGFIVYNEKNYPHLTGLFRHLQIPTFETSMTFGVTTEDGSLEWGAESLNALFAQRENLMRPVFYRFLADILRFNRQALKIVAHHPQLSLGGLIDKLGLGEWFRNFYLLPMGGAIWSCPLETMLAFPARFFVEFFDAHGLLTVTRQPQWRTVIGGSRIYVDKLIASFRDRIRTGCGAASISRSNGKVNITDTTGQTAEYDNVILACHGPEALALLSDPILEERDILGVFRHQKNVAYLHKHAALMPRRKACCSSWVYHAPRAPSADPISVTYWMNKLQHIERDFPVFVTLNPLRPIPEEDIFDRHVFYHPIYDPAAVRAQEKLHTIQGQNNTWFCGAYTRYGFHEDGLASAVAVAQQMGVGVPW